MTTEFPVQCFACTRLGAASRCEAYPDGIPLDIGLRGADHRVARGDEFRGLIFEQSPTDEGRRAFTWWERMFGSHTA